MSAVLGWVVFVLSLSLFGNYILLTQIRLEQGRRGRVVNDVWALPIGKYFVRGRTGDVIIAEDERHFLWAFLCYRGEIQSDTKEFRRKKGTVERVIPLASPEANVEILN